MPSRAGPPVSVYTAGARAEQLTFGGTANDARVDWNESVTRQASTCAPLADTVPSFGAVSTGTVSVPPVNDASIAIDATSKVKYVRSVSAPPMTPMCSVSLGYGDAGSAAIRLDVDQRDRGTDQCQPDQPAGDEGRYLDRRQQAAGHHPPAQHQSDESGHTNDDHRRQPRQARRPPLRRRHRRSPSA